MVDAMMLHDLILKEIEKHSQTTSPHAPLRRIASGLASGDCLVCTTLCGGKTNYSFQVALKNEPTVRVFAKACFSHPLWDNDGSFPFDFGRIDYEQTFLRDFALTFSGVAPVATPYFYVDLDSNAKLFVTEWSVADEQLVHQCTEGQVDVDVFRSVARALAKLHQYEGAPLEVNTLIRESLVHSLSGAQSVIYDAMSKLERDSRTYKLAETVGSMSSLLENVVDSYSRQESLVHMDFHALNILSRDEKICIVDWEMLMWGPRGVDPGKFMFLPLACALSYAVLGRRGETLSVYNAILAFWDEYVEAMDLSDDSLRSTFRDAVGWTGFTVFVFMYVAGVFREVLPLEEASDVAAKKAIDSIGYVGLQLWCLGYGDVSESLSYGDLKHLFKLTISRELESSLANAAEAPRPRSAAQYHRVSDASAYAEVARRTSLIQAPLASAPRRTSYVQRSAAVIPATSN